LNPGPRGPKPRILARLDDGPTPLWGGGGCGGFMPTQPPAMLGGVWFMSASRRGRVGVAGCVMVTLRPRLY
jgi:hypothetical protein